MMLLGPKSLLLDGYYSGKLQDILKYRSRTNYYSIFKQFFFFLSFSFIFDNKTKFNVLLEETPAYIEL